MCLQCSTKAQVVLEEVIPGYTLMAATNDVPKWRKSQYGLVKRDGPDFVWSGEPILDLTDGMTDEQVDALDDIAQNGSHSQSILAWSFALSQTLRLIL